MMKKRLQAWYAAEVQKQLKKNVAYHMSCMHAWIDILFRTCSHCYAGCILCILTALASFAEVHYHLHRRKPCNSWLPTRQCKGLLMGDIFC